MDRNTTIGLVLIFIVLVVFSYINKPSKEQIEAAKHRRDSIEMVKQEMAKEQEKQQNAQLTTTNSLTDTTGVALAAENQLKNLYGDFSVSATGTEEFIVLENNLLRLTVSTKGGQIHAVELKNYKRYDSTELFLIEGGKANHNITFFAQNRNIQTNELFFTPQVKEKQLVVSGPKVPLGKEGRVKFNEKNKGESKELVMRLDVGNGRYIDYVYTIKYNSYVVDYAIRTHGLQNVINTNTGFLSFTFDFDMPRQERASNYGEDRYATVYYKFKDDEVDHLSLTKNDDEVLNTPVKWIGFKQLFFSTAIISENEFANANVSTVRGTKNSPTLGHFKSEIGLPFSSVADNNYNMAFYFGPNHYQTLKDQGNNMEKLINLGWPVVREVNRYIIIPVFNFLRSRIANFGIIILILTIIIRLIVFPFTYKSYVSQAKMRALKPEIEEINKKYPPEKAMEKQQATMALYKKAGVNPMGGCLPMLFQMPVLIAMFYFFPGSIELRQESFLWATDLSTYDSILSWKAQIPFLSSFYGNHISLFTILMTVTTILQTRMSGQNQDMSAMPGMKYMMYFMPIFFMFILNSYSSGLSYYYFLANVISIGQTWVISKSIDEEKVRAQILVNKKKPVKEKSGFQKRLEEMAKQQEAARRGKK
jgi:YidC/Oxa1 family membrane protein insertase